MKVLILGAGAMGCLYGAAFHRAGADVTFVDVNQPHVDAINANGLELETRAGTEHLPIPARRPEEISAPVDLVVVFTKTFHTDAALAGVTLAQVRLRSMPIDQLISSELTSLPLPRSAMIWA